MNQTNIISAIEETGMIPVFNHTDVSIAENIIDAAYKGGVRVFEFTNRSVNAFEVFSSLVNHIKKYSDSYLGIGTVMDSATTQKFIDVGADFIVSPILAREMGKICAENQVLWIPGCATPSEVYQATTFGAGIIKIFPAQVLGPAFLSSIKSIMPGIKLMPTGGVEPTELNLNEWFSSGATSVGMGSQLFSKQIIASKDWSGLEKNVSTLMQLIQKIKTVTN